VKTRLAEVRMRYVAGRTVLGGLVINKESATEAAVTSKEGRASD